MAKEIEIPEGYEAKIVGNKVIIEKKESGDERIREDLLRWLKLKLSNPKVGFVYEEMKQWIAYLEKQKEQKLTNINPVFKIGDVITDGTSTFEIIDIEDEYYIADDGDKVCFYVAHRYYTPIENWETQKPAEWSEEDENFIKELCNLLATIAKNNYVGGYYAPDLVRKLQSLRPQPHWKPSEEEMEALKEAVYQLDGSEYSNGIDSLLNDLKKL